MEIAGIALTGRAWAGKSTVKEMLRDYGFVWCSFAKSVRSTAHELFGRGLFVKDRKLLQAIGMKMREIDPDVWVNLCMRDVEYWRKLKRLVVIDDLRYLNEAEKLRAAEFILVRIIRPGITDPEAGDHPSETEQDQIEVDYTILNDSGLVGLHQKVVGLMEHV